MQLWINKNTFDITRYDYTVQKVYIFIGAVVLAAAAFAGGVWWAQSGATSAPNGIHGQVMSRSDSSLTIQLSTGLQKTFVIGPQTSFVEAPPALDKMPADATIGRMVKVFSTGGGAANSVLLLLQAEGTPPGTTTPPGTP